MIVLTEKILHPPPDCKVPAPLPIRGNMKGVKFLEKM
jgi:hypothetical protein